MKHEFTTPVVMELPAHVNRFNQIEQANELGVAPMHPDAFAQGPDDPRKRGLRPEHVRASDEQVQHTLGRIGTVSTIGAGADRGGIDHRFN